LVRARTDRQSGAILLGVVIALMVVALAWFASLMLSDATRKLAVESGKAPRMARLDTALANFVAQNRRLPCPANGSLPPTNANYGRELINAAGQCLPANQVNGVLPWITLGVHDNDALDVYDNRYTYRVQPSLASNLLLLMDMSWCDPLGATNGATGAANSCAPKPCVSATCMRPDNFLYGKGLQVQDTSGAWVNQPAPAWAGAPVPPPPSNGAAYVLISHGANGAGAWRTGGILHGNSAGPQEVSNVASNPLTGTTIFIVASPTGSSGLGVFDDVLSHPDIATVLAQAKLGARTPH
jgi:hypothetical protein